jgi:hypothetical protein
MKTVTNGRSIEQVFKIKYIVCKIPDQLNADIEGGHND